jgi:hypothetical protein
MCSTGITGQSSSRGMCVIPNTYLHLTKLIVNFLKELQSSHDGEMQPTATRRVMKKSLENHNVKMILLQS